MSIPKGYKFSAVAAGFKKKGKLDLGLLVSDFPAVGAAMFTTNAFKAAPVRVGMELLAKGGPFRAVLMNSGQANACTGDEGLANCRRTLEMAGKAAGIGAGEILPGSTGVIGMQLKMDLFEANMAELVKGLSADRAEDFAKSIMTTDRFMKTASAEIDIAGKQVRLYGMAKGAGMICPNMATMLSVLLCDAKIDGKLWESLLQRAVAATFNRATVDGDTSTNDTIYALANGASGATVDERGAEALAAAMTEVLGKLAYMLVQDGEGATKVIHIRVKGAKNVADAEKAARTIGHSPLVKTAMFGQDANWGRIICALGYSGTEFDPRGVSLKICGVEIFKAEQPTMIGDDPALVAALKERDIIIDLDMGVGNADYELLASDLSLDYVTLNSDYRS